MMTVLLLLVQKLRKRSYLALPDAQRDPNAGSSRVAWKPQTTSKLEEKNQTRTDLFKRFMTAWV